MGAPDLGDGDRLKTQSLPTGWTMVGGINNVDPYSFFGFGYTTDGDVIPTVKCHNDKKQALDVKLVDWKANHKFTPINDSCSIVLKKKVDICNCQYRDRKEIWVKND